MPVSQHRAPPATRKSLHQGEQRTCPAYQPPTLGGLRVGIEQRTDYEYARHLVFPDTIGLAEAEDQEGRWWSPDGFCAIPIVPRFSFDIVLSPANLTNAEAPPEDRAPPSSKVSRSHTGNYVIHDIEGLRLGVRWRFDGKGYDVASIGPHRVRSGVSVTVQDPQMAGYLPVPQEDAPQTPAEVVLRISSASSSDPETFIHALGATATFGSRLDRPSADQVWSTESGEYDLVIPTMNLEGCDAFQARHFASGKLASLVNKIVVIRRGACTFLTKALNAARLGAAGIVIVGQGPTDPADPDFEGFVRPSAEGESAAVLDQVKDLGIVYTEKSVGNLIESRASERLLVKLINLDEVVGKGTKAEKKASIPSGSSERQGKVAVGNHEILNIRIVENLEDRPP